MDNYVSEIKNRIKKPNTSHRSTYLKNLLSRILISIIFLLGGLIYINQSDKNLLNYKKYILTDSLPFNKIETYLTKITGSTKIFKGVSDDGVTTVFNEKLEYFSKAKFYDGCALEVNNNYLVPIIESGIVVFIGEKENYGNTIIIQGSNGIDIWYSNITNSNVKAYEYVSKGNLLGEVNGSEMYLVFVSDGKFLDYEKYI